MDINTNPNVKRVKTDRESITSHLFEDRWVLKVVYSGAWTPFWLGPYLNYGNTTISNKPLGNLYFQPKTASIIRGVFWT